MFRFNHHHQGAYYLSFAKVIVSTLGTGSFLGVRCGWGVMLSPHPLLVPRSKIKYCYTPTLPKGLRGL